MLSLKSFDLDLRFSILFYKTRTSPTGSSASPGSNDGRCYFHLRLLTCEWPTRVRGFCALISAWWSCLLSLPSSASTIGGAGQNRRFFLLRGLPLAARGSHALSGKFPTPPPIGHLLFILLLLVLFVFFQVVRLFFFGLWQYLFSGWGFFSHFAIWNHFVRPLESPNLFVILPESWVIIIAYCYLFAFVFGCLFYWSLVGLLFSWFAVVLFGLIVGEPTPSLFVGFSTFSSFGIRSGNDPPL